VYGFSSILEKSKKARPVVAESVSRKRKAIEDAQLSATAQQIETPFLPAVVGGDRGFQI
jgi:hypothetical protein